MKFKNARVGDRVWSTKYGHGIITAINEESSYPIGVQFSNDYGSFTRSGYNLGTDAYPELFWNEFKFPKTDPPPKRLPDLQVDAKVYVKDNSEAKWGKWIPMHFSHFDAEGNLWTFANGRTSFTDDDQQTCWGFWKTEDGKYSNLEED